MIPAPAPDSSVPFHFGNPAHEARAFERGAAAVALAWDVVTVSGADRLTWLHSITSQHLARVTPGESTEALILSPHGHVEQAFGLVDDGATAWLLTDSGRGEGLVRYLVSMQFAARAEVTLRDDLGVVVRARPGADAPGSGSAGSAQADSSGGSSATGLAERLGPIVALWRDPWPATTGASYGPPDETHPATQPDTRWDMEFAVVADPEAALERWEATGGTRAGLWAFEAARVAAWRPRLNLEVDARALPHELDWLRTAVHMDKGCYRGQETVARVINLGRPPRRLVALHLDGSEDELPERGAEVTIPGGRRAVGHVTSVARHHELGPIALALVKRSTDPDAELRVAVASGEISAAQEIVVTPDGTSSHTPKERPGADLRGHQIGRPPAR